MDFVAGADILYIVASGFGLSDSYRPVVRSSLSLLDTSAQFVFDSTTSELKFYALGAAQLLFGVELIVTLVGITSLDASSIQVGP